MAVAAAAADRCCYYFPDQAPCSAAAAAAPGDDAEAPAGAQRADCSVRPLDQGEVGGLGLQVVVAEPVQHWDWSGSADE